MKKYRKNIALLLVFLGILSFFLGTSRQAYANSGVPRIETRGMSLNTGRSSDQIRFIKDFFRARGESNVAWGYNYDARTKELVQKFQRENGLKADGIAGKSTLDAMNREIAKNNYKIGPREPSANVSGNLLIINKSSNTLHHLKDGKLHRSYPVATGKRADLTPDGKHKVVNKFKDPGWGGAGVSDPIEGGDPRNPLGKRWIGISYGGGRKYGVHGNSNPSSIGKYVSLGCIRMFNDDVVKLYDEISISTPVWIGSEDKLISYGVDFKVNHGSNTGVRPEASIKESDISLILNGEKLALDDPIVNKEGVTYYPFREILEAVDAEVIWEQENQRAVAFLDGNKVDFKLGDPVYRVNGEDRVLAKGQKPFLSKSNKTYIPIRSAMEGLGFKVDWDASSRSVIIEFKKNSGEAL